MNREIKFRAWDREIDNNLKEHPKMIYSDDFAKTQGLSEFFDYIEKKSPLMQYTGLEDKNEVDIYGGDIIQSSAGNKWVIYWEDEIKHSPAWYVRSIGATKQAIKRHGEYADPTTKYLNEFSPTTKKIIGNIYENSKIFDDGSSDKDYINWLIEE